MINPMIAMTTSISTRVKPASARRSARRPLDIANRLTALSHLRDCQIAHHRSARGCHAQDFGRCGHPDPAFFDGIVQHGRHAGTNGGAVNDQCVGFGADKGPDFIGQFQQFKNSGAPAIASAAAAFATDRAIDRLAGRKTQQPITRIGDEVLLGKFMPILAAAAEDADQPLGNDSALGRSQQKSLDTKVQKPRHGRGCGLGVER